MLKIRLQRHGRKKRPVYRVVVAEHSTRVKGRYIEALGHYDPFMKQGGFTIDEEKVRLWIGKGAKPSSTIARLLKGMGVSGMETYIIQMTNRQKKNPTEQEIAAAEAKASKEAPIQQKEETVSSEPSQDAPAEDTPAEKDPVETQEEGTSTDQTA